MNLPRHTIERTCLGKGLTLVRSACHLPRPRIEESDNPHGQPMLVLTFSLTGESHFVSRAGRRVGFIQHHLTITSFRHSQGQRYFAGGQQVDQLRLLLDAGAVQHYLGQPVNSVLFQQDDVVQHGCTPFTTATVCQLAALHAAQHDPLQQQIAALTLLAQHRHLLPASGQTRLHPQLEQRTRQARQWMAAHLAQPLTLAALGQAVGLSQHQLKQGMQSLYGCPPGQLLLQLRMERALLLLEQGQQVAQAAWQVGYRHANNFSVAFHRHFGRHARSVGRKKQ